MGHFASPSDLESPSRSGDATLRSALSFRICKIDGAARSEWSQVHRRANLESWYH
jgi:hypothetical protein